MPCPGCQIGAPPPEDTNAWLGRVRRSAMIQRTAIQDLNGDPR